MTDVLSLVDDLSTPIEVACLMWAFWAAAHVVWYRRSARTPHNIQRLVQRAARRTSISPNA